MTRTTPGLLIFGTSHVGKSTLAQRVGSARGWRIVSTDELARHPGRPWPQVRAPVADYYTQLSAETIFWFLRTHHDNIWPLVAARIDAERALGGGFVLEGSALRPERLATLDPAGLTLVGLHADPAFLRARMQAQSGYTMQDDPTRRLIDAFIARSLRDNDAIRTAALDHGLRLVDAGDPAAMEGLFAALTAQG